MQYDSHSRMPVTPVWAYIHYNDPSLLPKLVSPDAAENFGAGAVLLQV